MAVSKAIKGDAFDDGLLRNVVSQQTFEEWLDARDRDVTSTEFSALFGVSPYETPFELHHRKAGRLGRPEIGGDRVFCGQILEPAIADAIAIKYGLTIRPAKHYISIPEIRAGSSFDFEIVDVDPSIAHDDARETAEAIKLRVDAYGPGNFEIKNVDGLIFRDSWSKNGDTLEAPIHIEIQAQGQMWVSGKRWSLIGVLVGGNEIHVTIREQHAPTIEKIRRGVVEFWQAVEAGNAPDPDYAADYETIKALNAETDPSAELTDDQVEALDALGAAYEAAQAKVKDAEREKREAQARIVELIGPVESAKTPGFSVSAKTVQRKGYTVEPKEYRDLRIRRRPQKSKAA